MNPRTLKVEEEGDPYKGKPKSKIRLKGSWLERAGFKPGDRVNVNCIAQGVMELRLNGQPMILNDRAESSPSS